mmetsp:Transcript_28801/g.83561  ORF Transcript_28801/g.83561 Transcript_28801/m.83561 type:complete len:249 (-) Transcript_28801:977-1723(-)
MRMFRLLSRRSRRSVALPPRRRVAVMMTMTKRKKSTTPVSVTIQMPWKSIPRRRLGGRPLGVGRPRLPSPSPRRRPKRRNLMKTTSPTTTTTTTTTMFWKLSPSRRPRKVAPLAPLVVLLLPRPSTPTTMTRMKRAISSPTTMMRTLILRSLKKLPRRAAARQPRRSGRLVVGLHPPALPPVVAPPRPSRRPASPSRQRPAEPRPRNALLRTPTVMMMMSLLLMMISIGEPPVPRARSHRRARNRESK